LHARSRGGALQNLERERLGAGDQIGNHDLSDPVE
jgi:hypothetical protein